MKTIKQKLQDYRRLFKITLQQTMTQGASEAWSEREIKKEVLN